MTQYRWTLLAQRKRDMSLLSDICLFGVQRVMTHSYVTWLFHMSHDITRSTQTRHVSKESLKWPVSYSFSCVTWLIQMWCDSSISDMTHPYVTWLIHSWLDSFYVTRHYMYYSKETYIIDIYHSKETYIIYRWTLLAQRKRDMSLKRAKNNLSHTQKRHVTLQRDIYHSKETYIKRRLAPS